ncbi:MAG: helix-turn-helix domain-containing protein, partial [Mycetocola sp.]
VTAEGLDAVPPPLAALVDTVVPVPALRERAADVMPLARYAARQTRLRDVDFTSAAEHVLTSHDWPGNIDELFSAVQAAALLAETIDVRHLPSTLVGRPGPHLSRIESVERDEIVRCLSRPGITVAAAAAELGMSRATIYRRMARLGITLPK